MAAFTLKRQNWLDITETTGPEKPQIFTISPSWKKYANSIQDCSLFILGSHCLIFLNEVGLWKWEKMKSYLAGGKQCIGGCSLNLCTSPLLCQLGQVMSLLLLLISSHVTGGNWFVWFLRFLPFPSFLSLLFHPSSPFFPFPVFVFLSIQMISYYNHWI